MGRISLISYETADEHVKQVMDEHVAKGYRITNMKRTLLHSVTAFQSLEDGFYVLQERLEKFLDSRAVAFFAYAISTQNDCIVCSTYFKKILDDRGISFDDFSFTETERFLVKLGRELVDTKGLISDETRSELLERFTEPQAVELTAFATMMVANNWFNNILDVQSELLENR